MVEELKLEKIYAQRGIELITPASGARILDRLINQKTPQRHRDQRRLEPGSPGRAQRAAAEDVRRTRGRRERHRGRATRTRRCWRCSPRTPEADRLGVVTEHVRHTVAGVFDCAVDDIEPDDILDDIGLDSMMAMDFRIRINTTFAIDLPVLEILKGVSVDSLAVRVLAELGALHGDDSPRSPSHRSRAPEPNGDDVDRLIDELSEADLRALLAELEDRRPQEAGGAPA